MERVPQKKPRYITLGPGGVKGFYIIGALHKLYIEGVLNEVQGYSGSSVGSIIGLLMICGYTPVEIMSIAADATIFTDFYNVSISERLTEMRTNYGVTSNKAVQKKLKAAVTQKFSRVPTMKELYLMTGIELYTTTYNLTQRKVVYISHHTHPNMDVVTSVLLSINIPLLFYKLTYEQDTYIDGAFCDPLPVACFDNNDSEILAIYINTHSVDQNHRPDDNFLGNLTYYIHQILVCSVECIRDTIIALASPKCQFLEVRSRIIDTAGSVLSVNEKANMVMDGYMAANNYLYSTDTETELRVFDTLKEFNSMREQNIQRVTSYLPPARREILQTDPSI